MIVAVLLVGVLFLAGLAFIGYAILTYHQQDAEARAGCGCYLAVVVALPMLVQAVAVVRTIPRAWQVRELGLELAEIHQAANISTTTSRFWDLKQLLPRLRERIDQPDDPVWEETRAGLRERLGPPSRFGRDVWQTFLVWGDSLLPPATPPTEQRAIVAALERLTGEDQLPGRIRQYGLEINHLQYSEQASIQLYVDGYLGESLAMHLFYPNEDVALLYFGSSVGGGSWKPFGSSANAALSAGEEVALEVLRVLLLAEVILVLSFALQRCFRWFALSLAGRLLLLGGDRRFQDFEREVYSPGRYAATLVLFGVAVLPLSLLTIEPYLVLIHPNYWGYFLACLWNLLVAGILVEGIEYLVGVLFLRFGIDPMTTFCDNLVAGILAAGLLIVVQNSWSAILLGLGLGMAQSLIAKLAWMRSRSRAGD